MDEENERNVWNHGGDNNGSAEPPARAKRLANGPCSSENFPQADISILTRDTVNLATHPELSHLRPHLT